jgi:hypothetical protein
MGRSSREGRPSTRPTWETLEAWRFRRLDAPAQLAIVYDGRMFRDGKLVKEKTLKAAA